MKIVKCEHCDKSGILDLDIVETIAGRSEETTMIVCKARNECVLRQREETDND